MLAEVCKNKGIDYDEWIKGLKKAKQWHVEVYQSSAMMVISDYDTSSSQQFCGVLLLH